MKKQDSEPQKAEEDYGKLTHLWAKDEYGIRYPDGREEFSDPSNVINIYGVPPAALGTLEGQGKAQDNYLLTLGMNGVPLSPDLRLTFVKRKRVTSITETVELHTEA